MHTWHVSASTTTKWRRGVALATLAVLAVVVAVSAFSDHLHVCRQEAAQTGADAMVELCGPLTATDPVVIVLAVVVAILFAPDASEVGLFGLVSWKRRVDETAAAQADLAEKVGELRVQVAQSQAQTVNVTTPAIDSATLRSELRRALQAIGEKEAELHD